MLNTIGQCIGSCSVWYANSIEFEDPIDISLGNVSLLGKAKYHAVWKMIIVFYTYFS